MCAILEIRILLANSCTRWCRIFIGLSQDRGRADFSKNLRASNFKKKSNYLLSSKSISLDSTFKDVFLYV
jgi:hypothetical protein